MFSCSLCAKTFQCRRDLNNHMLSHTKEKPHKCSICSASFGLESNLKAHVKSVHEGIQVIKNRNTQCPLCNYKCYSKTYLETHLRKHTAEQPFWCDIPSCKFKTKYKHALVRHVRMVHSDEDLFECPSDGCNYKGKSRGHLRRHLKIHSTEKSFACKVAGCDYSCRIKAYLKGHFSRAHNDEKPFKCQICEFRAKVKCDLTEHQRTHIVIKRFQCQAPNCGFSTNRINQVGRHFDAKNRKKNLRCTEPGCNYRCASSTLLKTHLKYHDLPILKCPEDSCNFSTRVRACLLQHISSRHEKVESISLIAPRRPASITAEPNPTIERLHCRVPNCDYHTEFPHRLDRHLKIHVEEEDRRHVCKLCFSTFRTSSKLHLHIQGHTREKANNCSFCDYSAVQDGYLRSHLRRVHNIHVLPRARGGINQFGRRCCTCGKPCSSYSEILLHSITHLKPAVVLERLIVQVV